MLTHSFQKLLSLGLIASLACLSGACAADPSEDATSDDEASQDLTAKVGYKKLRTDRDSYVYTGIAVGKGVAYLASNDRTIDVVSLSTFKKTKTFKRIAAESLTMSNGKLVACGSRNDSPLGWAPPRDGMGNNYVVSFLDPETGALEKEVVLKTEDYLDTVPGDLRDLPNFSCKVHKNQILIGFAQEKLQHEVVRFTIPSSAKSTFDFRQIPGAERFTVGKLKREGTITGFAYSAEHGLTIAAGGYGIERLDGRSVQSFRAAQTNREHFVDICDTGAAMLFAVDHDGKLLTLDAATGSTLDTTEIPDWLEAVSVQAGYAYVAGRKGLFVKKLSN
jgi:hypothetical protein